MVPGLKSFKESFSDFMEQYVIIGGAACDIYMESEDGSFRATKDLDIVLIVEALTPEFVSKFGSMYRQLVISILTRASRSQSFTDSASL